MERYLGTLPPAAGLNEMAMAKGDHPDRRPRRSGQGLGRLVMRYAPISVSSHNPAPIQPFQDPFFGKRTCPLGRRYMHVRLFTFERDETQD